MTNIQWTDEVWNPVALSKPLHWRKPRRVFVNSMSDLFHDDITFEQIAAVFGVMASTPHLTYQVLTKRPARMLEFFRWVKATAPKASLDGRLVDLTTIKALNVLRWHKHVGKIAFGGAERWPLPNVWLGVSVEDQRRADERIPLLLECPAAVRFLSVEPLLGPVNLAYTCFNGADSFGAMPGIDWVIVGGESGPGAGVCNAGWVRGIVRQCDEARVPCFVKQLGSNPSGVLWGLRDRKGGDPSEWPEDLRVQEFPEVKP